MAKFITNWVISIIIAMLIAMTSSAQGNTHTLTVEFKKIKQPQGELIVALYEIPNTSSQSWDTIQPVAQHVLVLKTIEPTVQFSELSLGHYAIRVFQDVNNNQLLDKSANNIPKEPVGFSQNPSLFKGEPTIEDCIITLSKDTTVSITLRHPKRKRKKRH